MKTLPDTTDGWIALVLFPFKTYVVAAFPFLLLCRWCKEMIQPRFYGYPEEATQCVSTGYVLCVGVLLCGAAVQAIGCRPGSATRTVAFVLLGLLFLKALWPWGMMGR